MTDSASRRFLAPILMLAAITPLLFLWLWSRAPIDLSEPRVYDTEVSIQPHRADRQTSATLSGEWRIEPSGAVPVKDAELSLQLPPGPWRHASVRINGDAAQLWRLRVRRGFESITALRVVPGADMPFEGENIPAEFDVDQPLRIEIAPMGGGSGRVDRVTVRLRTWRSTERPASFAGLVGAAMLPIAFGFFLGFGGRGAPERAVPVGGLIGFVGAVIAVQRPEYLEHLWIVPATFLAVGAVRALQRKGSDEEMRVVRRAAEVAVAAAIALAALWMRWDALVVERNMPLGEDASGYVEIARTGSFYETQQADAPWVREPLFPAALRLWFAFLPETGPSARLAAICIGVLPVLLVWFVGRAFFGPFAALGAAAFLAVSRFSAGESAQVLRDDLLTAATLAALIVPAYLRGVRWRRAAALGVCGAMLCLLRINNVLLVGALAGWLFWRDRWDWREALLALSVAVLPLLPHLRYNATIGNGDAFYSSNVHTRYYLNKDMIGQPGFPATQAEYEANPYAGGVVSSAAMFRYYPAGEVLRRFALGYANLFAWRFPHGYLFGGNELLMAFGLAGAVVLARRRELWWLAAYFAIGALPVAFIAAQKIDWRLALPGAPFILWVWAAGVEATVRWLAERAGALIRRR
jgi:hypothetical protein